MTIADAVRMTGRHRDTIQNWIKSGRLRVAVDVPRHRLMRRADVLAAARIQDVRSSEPAA